MNLSFGHALKLTALLLALVSGAACSKKASPIGSTDKSAPAAIELSKIYPTASGSSWNATPYTYSGRVYIKGLDLSISGVCLDTVSLIKVSNGTGDYTETTTCQVGGTFAWSRTFLTGEEGDIELTVTAYDSLGASLANGSFSTSVRIDNTAPAAPTIVSPSSTGSYTETGIQGPSIGMMVAGTTSSDTEYVVLPGNNKVAATNSAWMYGTTISDGATINFSVTALDRAGNVSTAAEIAITYLQGGTPGVPEFLVGSVGAGGVASDSGASGMKVEVSAGPMAAYSQDSTTLYRTETGLNNIVNQARSN